ncbi:MAG: ribonuclease R [Spirochaetes bacterium]|nr:ribonuclease R [Spirochaetota bacterium]
MPALSRKIISFINSGSSFFTAQQIEKVLSQKPSVKDKKKKKGKSRDGYALRQINYVLHVLLSIGYIERKRKMYAKSRSLPSGKIKINSSGNGFLLTEENDEIIIENKYLNSACNDDKVEVVITDLNEEFIYGRVVKVLERRKEEYFAKLAWKTDKYFHFKILDNAGYEVSAEISPEYYEDSTGHSPGDYAVIKLIDKCIAGKQGCVVVSFYDSGEEFDVRRIRIKHNLPGDHKDYEEFRNTGKSVIAGEKKNRKNYKKLFTVTIDGERAKDFDDAVSLEKTKAGYRLYVHIADVSAYVKKNSPLDKEALKRGNSYYLGNTVIPMLPEILSNDLCSLREGEEKLTLSAEMEFDKSGKETGHAFHCGIIKVDKRLTYSSADKTLDEKRNTKLKKLLTQMHELAEILKKNRVANGRIDLNLPDYELVYENNRVKDIVFAERLRSHAIVEEFMLSANEAVSRELTNKKIPALYRIHEDISEEKLESLKSFFRSLGLKLGMSRNIGVSLQNVINKVSGKEYEQVVNFVVLKSFMQAYYGTDPIGHFGLGFEDYTHFTSPIRRYPDLIVHRCLKTLINREKHLYETEELDHIGEVCSGMERVAQYAERDLFKLISCRFLKDRVGEVFDVVVSGVARFGLFVMIFNEPIEGMIPLRSLTDDYYILNEDEYVIVGRRLGRRFRIGDKLRARLEDVNYENMRIDFELAK